MVMLLMMTVITRKIVTFHILSLQCAKDYAKHITHILSFSPDKDFVRVTDEESELQRS